MKTIEATYRIVTPMFIGGANSDPSDGIRPPSFKGALRFWWRALHWGAFLQDTQGGDENAALKTLHKKECELFGSAAKMVNGKQEGGQGCFLLKVEQPELFQEDDKWPLAKPLHGSGYLGMGLWESGSKDKGNFQPHRKSIVSTTPFKVMLLLSKDTSPEDEEQLCRSLKALGLLGGLGSRSRRGFGSIAIQTLNDESYMCQSTDDYRQLLSDVFSVTSVEMIPPFTAWSKKSRIGLLKQQSSDAKDAHKQAAKLFYDVRGMKAEVRGVNKRGFGQPLPLKPMKKEYDQRRASPLFFHIHPIGNQYVCGHLFMPAQFLPDEGFDMEFFSGVSHYMNKLQEVSL